MKGKFSFRGIRTIVKAKINNVASIPQKTASTSHYEFPRTFHLPLPLFPPFRSHQRKVFCFFRSLNDPTLPNLIIQARTHETERERGGREREGERGGREKERERERDRDRCGTTQILNQVAKFAAMFCHAETSHPRTSCATPLSARDQWPFPSPNDETARER